MTTAHGIKSLRGEGGQQSRKEVIQISQHDDTKMNANEVNQKLSNARDEINEIIMTIYDTFQKYKQGLNMIYGLKLDLLRLSSSCATWHIGQPTVSIFGGPLLYFLHHLLRC